LLEIKQHAECKKTFLLQFNVSFIIDAKRTVEHSPHRFGSFCLEVSLLEVKKDEFVDDDKETYRKQSIDEEEVILTVSGNLPPKESSSLQDYFENKRRSGGGKVLSIDYTDEGDAVVTFADVKGKLKFSSLDSISL